MNHERTSPSCADNRAEVDDPQLTTVDTVYEISTSMVRLKPGFAIRRKLLTVTKAGDGHALLRPIFRTLDDDQEHLGILTMNVRLEVSGFKVIASGMMDRVYVDRRVWSFAMRCSSARRRSSLHTITRREERNPSDEDIALTRSLVTAGRALDVAVHDHVILGLRGYTSIAETRPDLFDRKCAPQRSKP